jgi:hypothetical protein
MSDAHEPLIKLPLSRCSSCRCCGGKRGQQHHDAYDDRSPPHSADAGEHEWSQGNQHHQPGEDQETTGLSGGRRRDRLSLDRIHPERQSPAFEGLRHHDMHCLARQKRRCHAHITSSIPRWWRLPAMEFRPPRQRPESAFLPLASEIHRQRRQLPPGRQPLLRTRRRADPSSILHDSYRMSPRPGSGMARKAGTAREFSVRASGATLPTASGRWRCVIACSRASRDSFGDPGAAGGMSWDGRVAARDDGDRGRGGDRA